MRLHFFLVFCFLVVIIVVDVVVVVVVFLSFLSTLKHFEIFIYFQLCFWLFFFWIFRYVFHIKIFISPEKEATTTTTTPNEKHREIEILRGWPLCMYYSQEYFDLGFVCM